MSEFSASAASGAALTAKLADLCAELRSRDIAVGTGQLIGAHRALEAVNPASESEAYLALRAALCAGRADLAGFDAAFSVCFSGGLPSEPATAIDPIAPARGARAVPAKARGRSESERPAGFGPTAWSDVELLRHTDFAEYTEAEYAELQAILARLARRGPVRPSSRTRPTRHRGRRPDVRGTLRASLRRGGEPIERYWRAPKYKSRPLVLVCDVSGSMEPYARVLLQYAQACIAWHGRCEAFAFSTRLTRVTDQLRERDPAQALLRAARAAPDWSGGTRIGAALAELNRRHGRRVGRGSVVVIVSDGCDRGEPQLLSDELARLARCAYRLVWLNPLKGSEGYEPLVGGMIAALPHVDAFLAGNSLGSLEHLATIMEEGWRSRSVSEV